MFKKAIVHAGHGGFGGPLVLVPTEEKNIILYITGGFIPEVAKKLSEITGGELVDGFKTKVADEKVLAVVIDCGGNLRCGIYPKKRIPTINIMATGKSGALAEFITEDIYVSGVKPDSIKEYEESAGTETLINKSEPNKTEEKKPKYSTDK